MSQRTKAIIIIISAFLAFTIIVSLVFDIFDFKAGKKEEAGKEQKIEVILPEKDDDLPEGKVFDSSNIEEFEKINPFSSSKSEQEQKAQDLAEFFIERIGTYSSDSGFSYIDDLKGFMSSQMNSKMEDYKNNAPKRDGYFSIESDIIVSSTQDFSIESGRAVFAFTLLRNEVLNKEHDKYEQDANVTLIKNSSGEWRVDNLIWGEKK